MVTTHMKRSITDASVGGAGLTVVDLPGRDRSLTFEHVNAAEARFLFAEIWEQKSYARHVPSLPRKAIVVDIGANIGLFSLWCLHNFEIGALLAVEPIDRVHAVLQRNLARHRHATSLCAAAGRRCEAHPRNFTFYQDAPGESTRNAEERAAQRRRLDASAFARRIRAATASEQPTVERSEDSSELAAAGSGGEQVACSVASLRYFLSEWEPLQQKGKQMQRSDGASAHSDEGENLAKRQRRSAGHAEGAALTRVPIIDLLKIDVEGDELDVLLGIDQVNDTWGDVNWWERIARIVVEVHDINNRLKEVVKLLKARGFEVCVDSCATDQEEEEEEEGKYVLVVPTELRLFLVSAQRTSLLS